MDFLRVEVHEGIFEDRAALNHSMSKKKIYFATCSNIAGRMFSPPMLELQKSTRVVIFIAKVNTALQNCFQMV